MDYREALEIFFTNVLNIKMSWEETIYLVFLRGRKARSREESKSIQDHKNLN